MAGELIGGNFEKEPAVTNSFIGHRSQPQATVIIVYKQAKQGLILTVLVRDCAIIIRRGGGSKTRGGGTM